MLPMPPRQENEPGAVLPRLDDTGNKGSGCHTQFSLVPYSARAYFSAIHNARRQHDTVSEMQSEDRKEGSRHHAELDPNHPDPVVRFNNRVVRQTVRLLSVLMILLIA